MDKINDNPYEINSFNTNKVFYANVVDLNKKRKILDEQLGLPLAKHKFRDRSSGSEHVSPFVEDLEMEKVLLVLTNKGNIDGEPMDDESEHQDSAKDSNSFVGESDTATSQYVEAKCEPEFLQAHANDHLAKFKQKIPNAYAYDQPSTSSGSCGNNRFTNTITVKEEESPFTGREPNTTTPEGGLHREPGSKGPEGELSEFVNYAYEIEECLDEDPEDMMLYSNAATSDLFVLSSGRWNINQDSQLGVRRPTIDQEFEQYFSTLML